jgi:hypothetical protein
MSERCDFLYPDTLETLLEAVSVDTLDGGTLSDSPGPLSAGLTHLSSNVVLRILETSPAL